MEYKNKDGTAAPEHIATGKLGEAVAADYLVTHGYTIVCRNYKCYKDEIDIIASDGKYIVFVEVKTRHEFPNSKYGRPSRAVDLHKRRNIVKAAKGFIRHMGVRSAVRFDVMEIFINEDGISGQTFKVRHIKSAFGAGGKIGY